MRVIAWIFLVLTLSCGGEKKSVAPAAAAAKAPRIAHFYATANPVPKGESATLCYGTEEATEVRLTPYPDSLKPALNRCVAVSPTQSTGYTLTVKGPGGEASQKLQVEVGGARPKAATTALIQSFQFLGPAQVAAGTRVQFCYSTTPEVVAVSVTPKVAGALQPGVARCFVEEITRTSTYILTATDGSGATDRMQVSVKVL
jgi:hypothetical protein